MGNRTLELMSMILIYRAMSKEDVHEPIKMQDFLQVRVCTLHSQACMAMLVSLLFMPAWPQDLYQALACNSVFCSGIHLCMMNGTLCIVQDGLCLCPGSGAHQFECVQNRHQATRSLAEGIWERVNNEI